MQDSDVNNDVPPTKTEAQAAVSSTTGGPHRLLPTWALVIGAGTLAGLASWVAGEPLLELFQPPYAEVQMRGSAMRAVSWHDQAMADARNAATSFAAMGGLLGALLGAAGGLGRKNGRVAAMASLLGLILGAAVAGGMAMPPTLVQRVSRAAAGRGDRRSGRAIAGPRGGVGDGRCRRRFGLRDRPRRERERMLGIVLGGFFGAALGTVIYEFIGAIAFPMAGTTRFILVTTGTRLVARAAVTVFAAAGVAMGLTMKLSREGAPARSATGQIAAVYRDFSLAASVLRSLAGVLAPLAAFAFRSGGRVLQKRM